jgi:nitrite reductase (NADH) small subunit
MSSCVSETASKHWVAICPLDDIPVLGSRVVKSAKGDIAVFRNGKDEVFALYDKCPHQGGPLSQGIVHDRGVTCPLHGWKIDLRSGVAQAPDVGCTQTLETRINQNLVYLCLAP